MPQLQAKKAAAPAAAPAKKAAAPATAPAKKQAPAQAAAAKKAAKPTRDRSSLAEQTEFVKALWYGDWGKGKTTALASLAHLGHMVHIDAESGLKKRPLSNLGVPLDNIEPFRLSTEPGAAAERFENLNQLFWELKDELEDPDAADPVIGIMWDSVTETQKLLLEDIVGKGVAKAERSGQDRDEFQIYREDWGVNTEQMRRLIRRFRDLPCHVGFSALPRRDVDDDGVVVYGPAVSPALQTDLLGYVDIVIHVDVVEYDGQVFYVGDTSPAGKYIAKDRFGVLPRKMVDPTFPRIIDYVNGVIEAENDPLQQEFLDARRSSSARAEAEKAQGSTKKTHGRQSVRQRADAEIKGEQEATDAD